MFEIEGNYFLNFLDNWDMESSRPTTWVYSSFKLPYSTTNNNIMKSNSCLWEIDYS
jgi:hypothetical protein